MDKRYLVAVLLLLWPFAVMAQDDANAVDDGGASDPARAHVEDALREAGVFGSDDAAVPAPGSAALPASEAPASAPAAPGSDAAPIGSPLSMVSVPQGYARAQLGQGDEGVMNTLNPEARVKCESADAATGQLPGVFGVYKFVRAVPDCSKYGIRLPWQTTLTGAQLGFGRGFSENALWDKTLNAVASCVKEDTRVKGRIVPRMDATHVRKARLRDSEFVAAAKMKYGMAPTQLNDTELQSLVGDWRIQGVMRLLTARGVDTTNRVVGSNPEISTAQGGEERGMRVELFYELGEPIYVPYCERRPAAPVAGPAGPAGRSGLEVSLRALCEFGSSHYDFCGGEFNVNLNLAETVAVYGTIGAGAGTYSNPVDSYEFEGGISYLIRAGGAYWFMDELAGEAGFRYQEENVDREFYRSSRGFGVDLQLQWYPGDDRNVELFGRLAHLWMARVVDEPTNEVGRNPGGSYVGGLGVGYRFW